VLERVEPGGGPAQRARDDEPVPRPRARPPRNPLAPAHRRHGDERGLRLREVAPEHGHARLGEALVELEHLGQLGLQRQREADEQPVSVRAERGQVAQVDGRGLVAEIAPRHPVPPEVDALDEDVLRDDHAVREHGALRVEPAGELSALELGQERDLTQL
jgi:hypothetical protein